MSSMQTDKRVVVLVTIILTTLQIYVDSLPTHNKKFILNTGAKSWNDAKMACERIGQTLVQITNDVTAKVLEHFKTDPEWETYLSGRDNWLGLHKQQNSSSASWIWHNCVKLTYSRWNQGQPEGNGLCASVSGTSGNWTSAPCDRKLPFVCTTSGGDCAFVVRHSYKYPDVAPLSIKTLSVKECQEECRTVAIGNKECWGFTYYTLYDMCLLHMLNEPLLATESIVLEKDPSAQFHLKNCFKALVNIHTISTNFTSTIPNRGCWSPETTGTSLPSPSSSTSDSGVIPQIKNISHLNDASKTFNPNMESRSTSDVPRAIDNIQQNLEMDVSLSNMSPTVTMTDASDITTLTTSMNVELRDVDGLSNSVSSLQSAMLQRENINTHTQPSLPLYTPSLPHATQNILSTGHMVEHPSKSISFAGDGLLHTQLQPSSLMMIDVEEGDAKLSITRTHFTRNILPSDKTQRMTLDMEGSLNKDVSYFGYPTSSYIHSTVDDVQGGTSDSGYPTSLGIDGVLYDESGTSVSSSGYPYSSELDAPVSYIQSGATDPPFETPPSSDIDIMVDDVKGGLTASFTGDHPTPSDTGTTLVAIQGGAKDSSTSGIDGTLGYSHIHITYSSSGYSFLTEIDGTVGDAQSGMSSSGHLTSSAKDDTLGDAQGGASDSSENDTCWCPCGVKHDELNLTQEQIEVLVEEVVKEIKLDVQNLSSTHRKHVSMGDRRSSAQGIGAVGIVILCGVFGGVLVLDFTTLCRSLWNLWQRSRSSSEKHFRQLQAEQVFLDSFLKEESGKPRMIFDTN